MEQKPEETVLRTLPGRWGVPSVMLYRVERSGTTEDGKPLYAAGAEFIEGPLLQACIVEAQKKREEYMKDPNCMGVTILRVIEETRRVPKPKESVVLDTDFDLTRRKFKNNGRGD